MRKQTLIMALSTYLLAIAAAQPAVLSASPGSNVYKTYTNTRFSYSISYPANLLIPQGEAENGDGQTFRAQDGRAEMRVWGQNNVNSETLRTSFTRTVNEWGDGVSYKVIKGDWFVVTALVNKKVNYQKTMLRRGVFKTLQIEYDATQRATFDPVAARISKSFVG
jgi:hypothetical protein